VIYRGQEFLALMPMDGPSALIVGVQGEAAEAELQARSSAGENLEMPAPEGVGLHVWQGTIEVVKGSYSMDGEWRRATSDDLERFGMPLCEATSSDEVAQTEPVEPAGTDFCCGMRRKFVPGILAEDVNAPAPIDLVDHVLHWGTPIVLALSYCPFCGRKVDRTQALRVLKS
jgi:hypothetical protein